MLFRVYSKFKMSSSGPIILENVSYYAAPGQQMSEIEFTQQVLRQSGCALLLDVNNVFVNSINHKYDAKSIY